MNRFYSSLRGIGNFRKNATSISDKNIWIFSADPGKNSKLFFAIFIGLFLIAGFQNPVNAQSGNQKETGAPVTANTPAKAGTYQLIFNSRREDKEIKLTQQELIVIEKLRKENEVVYAAATYSDDIRVKILPRTVINSSGFTPAPLKYFKEEQSYNEYSQIRYIELQ